MSVKIRLSKIGKKNNPSYRIVATTTRYKRNGKELDILGFYNPLHTPVLLEYDKKKLDEWKKKGATLSESVEKLIEKKYQFVKYEPHKEKEEKKAE